MYNPQQPELMSELELLYDYFVIQNGLMDINCIVFINQRENNSQEDSIKTLRKFHKIFRVPHNLYEKMYKILKLFLLKSCINDDYNKKYTLQVEFSSSFILLVNFSIVKLLIFVLICFIF